MFKWLIYRNTYNAVEHTFDKNNADVFNLLSVQKTKNQLFIKKKQQYTSFKHLLKQLKQQYIFLIINSKEVLLKEVENVNLTAKPIQEVFPNIVLSDFYYEVLHSKDKYFVSISRKTYVDKIISQYQNNKIDIIGFSLGSTSIEHLLPFVEGEITISNAVIRVKNQKIASIKKDFVSIRHYLINSLDISTNYTLLLGGILGFYFNLQIKQHGLEQSTSKLKNNFQQKRIFKVGLYTALGFLFALLCINFLIFSSYHSKINKINSDIQINETHKNKLLQLKEQVRKKEELVSILHSVSNSKVSFYLDEIGQLIPRTVLLSALNYQPLSSRVKNNKAIKYRHGEIVVKGISKKTDTFTNFIESLEAKNWIGQVTIMHYEQTKSNISLFEVLIRIKNE
ncbi:MAG: hypothetical protein ACK5H1_01305 [Tenacibaculum sp.]